MEILGPSFHNKPIQLEMQLQLCCWPYKEVSLAGWNSGDSCFSGRNLSYYRDSGMWNYIHI